MSVILKSFCLIAMIHFSFLNKSSGENNVEWKTENIYTVQFNEKTGKGKIIQLDCNEPIANKLLASYLAWDNKGNYKIIGIHGENLDQLNIFQIKAPYVIGEKSQLKDALKCVEYNTSVLSSYGRCYPFFQLFNTVLAITPNIKSIDYPNKLSIKELSLQGLDSHIISVSSISNKERNGKLIIAYDRFITDNSKETIIALGILDIKTGVISEFFATSSLLQHTQPFDQCSLQWISNDYIVAVSPSRKSGTHYQIYGLSGDITKDLSCVNHLLIYQDKLYELEISNNKIKALLLFEPPHYHYDEMFQSYFVNP